MSANQLRLDTVEGFFGALRSPELPLRISVLKAIAASPQLALAYGRFEGQDVVDELVHQSYQTQGFAYWHMLVTTLAAFDDPRVVAHFKKVLTQWDRPEVLALATARLLREPLDDIRPMLRNMLHEAGCRPRLAAAASLLVRADDLTDWERIRVSAANQSHADIAGPVTPENGPDWARELAGPYGPEVQVMIVSRGADGYEAIAKHWTHLSDVDRAWLLEYGAASHPLLAIPIIRAALVEPQAPIVVHSALRSVAQIEGGTRLFGDVVTPFADSSDPETRRLAVLAGAAGLEWKDELSSDKDVPSLCAALARAGEEEVDLTLIVALVAHPDWKVRACASRALVQRGAPSVPVLRAALAGAGKEARVAISSALFSLGDVEWLEEHLIEA